MTDLELHNLVRAAKRGDEAARTRVIAALLPLVRALAGRAYRLVTPLYRDDAVIDGMAAVDRSIDLFALGGDASFRTYAGRAIERAIRRYARRRIGAMLVPVQEQIRGTGAGALFPRSLDQPVGESGRTRGELLPSEAPTPEDLLASAEEAHARAALFSRAFGQLDLKQRECIRLRFLGEQPRTLEQVARVLDVSRQRVAQITDDALLRLVVALGVQRTVGQVKRALCDERGVVRHYAGRPDAVAGEPDACSRPGCGKPVRCRGLCRNHYQSAWNARARGRAA